MVEKWRKIKGFSDKYEVSNFGRIKSYYKHNGTSERILKPRVVKDGYYMVALYKNKKPINTSVHQIVASAFLPNPFKLHEVNHKDGVKTNNHVDNLEWCTHHQNVLHYFNKLKKN